jgi:hypothetical protein
VFARALCGVEREFRAAAHDAEGVAARFMGAENADKLGV